MPEDEAANAIVATGLSCQFIDPCSPNLCWQFGPVRSSRFRWRDGVKDGNIAEEVAALADHGYAAVIQKRCSLCTVYEVAPPRRAQVTGALGGVGLFVGIASGMVKALPLRSIS
jgi:hypothetical protein